MRKCFAFAALVLSACSATPDVPDAFAPDAGPDSPPRIDAWAPDTGPGDAGPLPATHAAATPLAQWADTMIGTGGLGFNDVGGAHPGPQWPFGMIRPGADTCLSTGTASNYLHTSGYHAGDTHISGFSHTRMHGVGINDYGVVALMPTIGASVDHTTPLTGLIAPIVTGSEHAAPGRYEVSIGEPASPIGVELTASARVGFHRITFPATGEAAVFVDLAHTQETVTILAADGTVDPSAHEISGSVHFSGGYSNRFGGVTMYFVMRFDTAFTTQGSWEPGTLHPELTRTGTTGGLYVTFAPHAVVRAAVAVSFVDVTGARANLDAEDRALDFDAARAAAVAEWERRLGVLELEGRSDTDFQLAYTALYHSLLMPTLATDVDHRYRDMNQMIATATDFTYYTDFSMWDTYRTLHSLISIIDPATQTDFVRSMMAMAEALGQYPRWPLGTGETDGMIGDPAAVIVYDTWARGVHGFDLMHAYEMFVPIADGTRPGRGGVQSYTTLGYVSQEQGSAAMTMEYSIADDSIASMAHELGLTDDEARFRGRSHNYRNNYDSSVGWFVNRHADGTFVTGVNPNDWGNSFAEGDARQYLWLAPHDPDGLAATLGGTDTALGRLRDFFARSAGERHTPLPPVNYWQGNEPDIHVPYLFALWGAPDEAEVWSRWALRAFYSQGPNGLPGNDDGGTMSAWLLFTELGLYPLAGSDQYVVGSPLFTHATLHLPGGDLVIEAPSAWDPYPYVTSLTLDGATIPRVRISQSQIAHGATLHFEQSQSPSSM